MLSKDPELKYNKNGTAICTFSIPTKESRDEESTWHNIVCFKNQAEFAAKYFQKGTEVLVVGKQTHTQYQTQNGETKYNHDVIAHEFDPTWRTCIKPSNDNQKFNKDVKNSMGNDDDDDDLPF